ncbi:hypothetical protein LUZ60_009014 [Juncus effusus]|nr:hypothetical protein LUZ60_009014 [Juncus effusus]
MKMVLQSPLMKGFGVSSVLISLLILSNVENSTAQATPESEVGALNTIFMKFGLEALPTWNISGEPCSGWATNSSLDNNKQFNPGIECDCTYDNNQTCHIVKLKIYALSVTGTIPNELQNLTFLNNLEIRQNYLTGSVPAFIGNFTEMQYLSFGTNALSGPIPKELGNLQNLKSLSLSTNNLSGSIPEELGNLSSLEQMYLSSNGLSGELPETLSNLNHLRILWAHDNEFTGKIPDFIGTLTSLTDLRFHGNSFTGPIPTSLSNLDKLTSLRIGDITNGSSSTLEFISNMTYLSTLILRNCKISDTLPTNLGQYKSLLKLDLSFNAIIGQLPQSLFNLGSLIYLFLGNNSLDGNLPPQKSISLLNIDLSYNQLNGSFPSWASENNLKLNLVANNFIIDSSNNSFLPSGLNCLQRDIPCHKDSPIYSSFAIRCGALTSLRAQDGTLYQSDNMNLSAASYFVTDDKRWGVSNVGAFAESVDDNYIIRSSHQFENTLDSELFQNARMSPSSLRYYGLGLQNGNYSVKLQFTEIAYLDPPDWRNNGRRIFDIYIQGDLKEKNFDIKKEAGGRLYVAVVRNFIAPVTNNFLEIHLFWAGKGTCCVPTQGYYGPAISAISASPYDFTPTVSNKELGASTRKTGLIVGVVVGAAVLGLLAVFAILFWRRKKKKSEMDKEFMGIVDRPDLFSYAELRSATEAFKANNFLGEGGYGPVYKGKLSDGRIVAVKQLAVTSLQGKRQFVTEIATISAVQHRNLVKLYGCCTEGNTPLLVYEYLENRSLDQALFGKQSLYLDWSTRFEICLGVARGLAYLHEESSVRIVHRDIKASNVLLDGDLNPKISDFGLAKLYDDKKSHISTRVAGTIGYLAPEYAMRGHLTEKTDVFAFGILALEVVAGRTNTDPTLNTNKVYLLDWAWGLYEKKRALDIVDPKLRSFNEEQVLRLMGISFMCTQSSLLLRPSMSRVVTMIIGDVDVNEVTSKPSYLTEWQFKDITSASISTGEFYGSSPEPLRSNQAGQIDMTHSYSADILMDSIIQDGR